ncbi:MAG: zinc-dependent alcohol dehydrogenase family protein [Candidatus Neomarinimicrobiota bacterium]
MKAALFKEFNKPLVISSIPRPEPGQGEAIISVKASGICRSDWHGWKGHDPDIKELPHVPGHEFTGIVAKIGRGVKKWTSGDRITAPFVNACGNCPECRSGNQQICDNQSQPGFTHWGSFAEFVRIRHADTNLVQLPDELDFITAASLGCRFSTAYRALKYQGKVEHGQWVAIHGCGGVGLSAIMIARALGAKVIAVDINQKALKLAIALGADSTLNGLTNKNIVANIRSMTRRGVHVSVDSLGSLETCRNSIQCLRKGGRHVQIGLMAGADYQPSIPMEKVIAEELHIVGSHGFQAAHFSELLDLAMSEKIDLKMLIGKKISLEQVPSELENMDRFNSQGITIINRF